MLVDYKYTYLFAVLLSFIPWILLFLHRKDLRKEMITMSILVCVGGLFMEYFWWSKDWWHPLTITGTRIGIEDILNGITTGGIAAVLYEELFKKRLYRDKSKSHTRGSLIIAFLLFLITAYLFHITGLPSFIASTVALIIASVVLIVQRKDLLMDAFLTGTCMVIGIFPFYLMLNFISPGYIEKTWEITHLSGIIFFGDPIEDIIFYFFFGFFIGPFYLYWKGERLGKKSSK